MRFFIVNSSLVYIPRLKFSIRNSHCQQWHTLLGGCLPFLINSKCSLQWPGTGVKSTIPRIKYFASFTLANRHSGGWRAASQVVRTTYFQLLMTENRELCSNELPIFPTLEELSTMMSWGKLSNHWGFGLCEGLRAHGVKTHTSPLIHGSFSTVCSNM